MIVLHRRLHLRLGPFRQSGAGGDGACPCNRTDQKGTARFVMFCHDRRLLLTLFIGTEA
jgi:hypothetical protein